MTKEEWDKISDKDISYETLFDYYSQYGGPIKTIDEFVKVWKHLDGKMIANTVGKVVLIDLEKSKEKVREYYNGRYKN